MFFSPVPPSPSIPFHSLPYFPLFSFNPPPPSPSFTIPLTLLGNALRHTLMNSQSHVEFSGYSVPHPSEAVLQIRIQHVPNSSVRVSKSLKDACGTVGDMCDFVKGVVMKSTPAPASGTVGGPIKVE